MRHRAVLARTIRPCRVIVAMPIAASSNTLWNRSTWSSSVPAPSSTTSLVSRRHRLRRPLVDPASVGPPTTAASPATPTSSFDDVLERRGLGEVRRGAEVEGPQRERLLVEPAEHDDAGARGALEHQGQGRQAVHPGHGDVQQHGVGLEATSQVDGVGAVGALALHDRGAGQPELGPDQGADLGRVVDDHDPHGARACRRRRAEEPGSPSTTTRRVDARRASAVPAQA